ncbi:MAG: sigma-70 family RNA polymerase sigma factor [Lachnospiraceae bacterium]|nr:sigma-70 family RNA polymerase sigma factor [Lachnospiraceae bacterium]
MEDKQIIDLYWERSERAIEETASKYGKYCYSIAFNILYNNEDADESVNDTYLGAWKSMPPHKPELLSAFLGKITRHISLNKWRHKNAEKRGGGQVALALDELLECVPSQEKVDEQIEAKELAKTIDTFLATLKEDERRVFVCRYWYLDPIADICKQFGYSESKVKSMLFRTRGKLLTYLEKEGVFVEV